MDPNVRSGHPKEALAAYAEPWIGEGRVAVFGNATYGLGPRLADLGASVVELWDPDEGRVRAEAERAPQGVTVQLYSSARTLPRRALDLAIVPDLGLFDDPEALIARLREMVGTRGIVLLAATNRDAPGQREARAFDYYELFDLVAAEFAEVRMVAEVPFHGVAMVRLGDDEEPHAVSVDTQLAPTDRTAEAFVVVAAQWPASFDAYTILELGDSGMRPSVRDAQWEAERARLARTLEQVEIAHGEALRSADALRAELRVRTEEGERAIVRSTELESALRDRSTRSTELESALRDRSMRSTELESALRDRSTRSTELESALRDRSMRSTELESALREQSARVAELESALIERARHLSELSSEVEEKRAAAEAGRVAAAEMEQLAHRADRAERLRGEVERESAKAAEAHAQEVARFEEALRDRGRAVKDLEREVARQTKMVRELVATLEERPESADASVIAPVVAPPPRVDAAVEVDKAVSEENARLREQLNRMALDIARREGEAQAAAWTVAELERRLALVGSNAPLQG